MPSPPGPESPHILVADDNAMLRTYFERLLGNRGYRVTAVADGEEARGRLSQGDIDAVLSDIDMPGMTGIQLLQHVGASVEEPPVVLVTGNPNVETAMQAVNGRAVAYLQKPVEESALIEAVQRAVRISKLAKNRRTLGALIGIQEPVAHAQRKDQAALDNALNTLWMAYQPIVQVGTGQVFAYEALVRNDDPQLRAPPDLLKAAEAHGRVREMSRKIRDLVAQTIAQIPAKICVFVNLVPDDLADDQLCAKNAPLSAHASRVVLEVTERDSLDEVSDLPERLRALRELGYRIAVDDLGAGYSGLTSVVALQPEVVKLDMALVRDIHKNDNQRRLVASIASALQAEFNTLLVAEGIETAHERDALCAMGSINLLQGYFFGKPQKTPTAPDPELIRKI